MVCSPAVKVEVWNEAVPPPLTGSCARMFEPSWKVTMPVGVPEPAGTDVTVAVTVTISPIAEGFGDELTAVVEPRA